MQRFIFGNVPQREDLNQLRTEFTSSLQTLERNMQVSISQIQTTVQTLGDNLTRELPQLQKQVQDLSRPSPVPGKLDELQKQVNRLTSILSTTVSSLEKLREEVKGLPELISPLAHMGERDIEDTVNSYAKTAVDATYALVQEFVLWAEEIRRTYYDVQKTQEEANSKMQERLRPPTPKAPHNGENEGHTDIPTEPTH